jgi:hypothetical protein
MKNIRRTWISLDQKLFDCIKKIKEKERRGSITNTIEKIIIEYCENCQDEDIQEILKEK